MTEFQDIFVRDTLSPGCAPRSAGARVRSELASLQPNRPCSDAPSLLDTEALVCWTEAGDETALSRYFSFCPS